MPASAAPGGVLLLLAGLAALALLLAAHELGRRRALALPAGGGGKHVASSSPEEAAGLRQKLAAAEAEVEQLRTALVKPAAEVERMREASAALSANMERLREENKQLAGDAAYWRALAEERKGEENSSERGSPPTRAKEAEAADREVGDITARADAALRLDSRALSFYTPKAANDPAEVGFAHDANDAAKEAELELQRTQESEEAEQGSPPTRAEEDEASDQEVDDIAARAEAALRLAREEELDSQAAEFHNYMPKAVQDPAEVGFTQDANDAAMEAELELQRILQEVKEAEQAAAAERSFASAGGELQQRLRSRQRSSESPKDAGPELQRVQGAKAVKEEAAAANRSFASAGDELQQKLKLRRQASQPGSPVQTRRPSESGSPS